MKLTVAAIFLIDDNWKVFREHREIIGKPLRQEEIEEVEKMLRCKVTFTFSTSVSVTPFGSVNSKIRMSGNMLQEVLLEEDVQIIMNEGLDRALSLTAVHPTGKLTTTWAAVKGQ